MATMNGLVPDEARSPLTLFEGYTSGFTLWVSFVLGPANLRSDHSAGPETVGHAARRRRIHYRAAQVGVRPRRTAGRDPGAIARRPEHDGPAMFARISVMRALNRHVERVFNASRKDTHWGRRKLKRDAQ